MDIAYFRNITLQQMEALIALVEEGSFSRAANKMLLTQPALTKNIKKIESYLGLKIVDRSGAGVTLTAEGRIIYDYARRIVSLRNEAGDKIFSLRGREGGDIYIGASTIPATYLLPSALGAFRKKNSAIRLHIRAADSDEVINMVLAGEAEIGFVGKKPPNKIIVFEPLWHDRLVLVVPYGHPWRKKKAVTVSELQREPFILREKGSATRDAVEAYLKSQEAVDFTGFNICCEFGSSEAVKEAILAGLGVSIISVFAVSRELKQKLLAEVQLTDCNMERDFYIIRKRQMDLKPQHKLFLDFVEGVKAGHNR